MMFSRRGYCVFLAAAALFFHSGEAQGQSCSDKIGAGSHCSLYKNLLQTKHHDKIKL